VTKPATKKDRRAAAREVKTWLGFYLYTLEPWYGKDGNETALLFMKNKKIVLLKAREELDRLIELEDTHGS
jgi:hypothetical protein